MRSAKRKITSKQRDTVFSSLFGSRWWMSIIHNPHCTNMIMLTRIHSDKHLYVHITLYWKRQNSSPFRFIDNSPSKYRNWIATLFLCLHHIFLLLFFFCLYFNFWPDENNFLFCYDKLFWIEKLNLKICSII